ncbi:primosomal protein N' [Oleiagrimonas sp. C23AA]|uniref:primosomal protein N' n=1 Tax=Oleiagrimonas sp. C23AA TaxID=2719047 RepID=UPI0014235558|nr:primosomal protein N' [Oleiagrimonas sp. C23AA]NII11975.1 primosomal protein N' [Oleiagrimonas sp. C23AA]
MSRYLRVALPVPLPKLFDYRVPVDGSARAGMRVKVPFGRSSRVGVVVALSDQSEFADAQIKPVQAVLDPEPLFNDELRASLQWAADYWAGALGEVYQNALPTQLREARSWPDTDEEAWQLTEDGRQALAEGKRRGSSRLLLQALADGALPAAQLGLLLGQWREAARRLAGAGLVEAIAWQAPALTCVPGPTLNDAQREAVQTIDAKLDQFGVWLLDGVTGSGKTEVYLALIRRTLDAGRQALMLVPEIGLAPQAVKRLRERLGVPVEVLHSNLADGERARAWLRARSGEARVILGTRSAVFTPLPEAGLIVIDEEHDASYKQQDGFRYHGRDLSVVRAQSLGIPVLLGSATPSLETLANVEAGRYQRLHLSTRARAHAAPTVQIVDVRAQRLDHGLSPTLLGALRECVDRGEQALVFRNRRGYAPVLLCHACGWHADCTRCEKPMTLHARRNRLICHHCGSERPVPTTCPACGYTDLKPQGHGTERLEEAIAARFTDVPVLRIDRETTRRRDAFSELLAQLDADKPAILIGTQILAKGHDLPNLTLVAVVGVDEGLHSVDFRAAERLAQLVVQVAGRAGRASKPGRVLLQTHHPDHPLLRTLLRSGYAAVARELLDERRTLTLPPFSHQALLRVDATQRAPVDAFLAQAHAAMPASETLRVLGPMPAPMPLRAGRHRGQLLLEADSRRQLHGALKPWLAQLPALPDARRVRWSLDVDPIDLY